MAQGRGPWLSTATALFFGWALLFLAVRIWVTAGRKQSWNLSDTSAVAAFTVAVLHVAATFWAISHGYGRPLGEIEGPGLGYLQKALFISQLSYVGSVGLTKVSTAFFVGHLTRHAPQVRMSCILAAVSGIWTVASILVIALRPNLARPWASLDGAEALYYRWIAVEATGLGIEIALWLLSISLVWGLQMKLQKRVLILTVFGCRLLLIPVVGVRLFYLAPEENHEPTVTNILPHILTEVIMEYALISTSITTLKPFLKPFHTGAIVNTVGGGASGLYSGSHSGSRSGAQGVYMLSSVAKKKKYLGNTTSSSLRSDTSHKASQPRSKLYTGNGGEFTAVVSTRTGRHREDMQSMESGSSEQMMIRTQKEWSVQYETR